MAAMGEAILGGGRFYGAVRRKRAACDGIFTELQHPEARRLPRHAHELPFFCLLIEGEYGEAYGRDERQYPPFSITFRPAGIPHQDEVGPRGARFFQIELGSRWQGEIRGEASAGCEDCRGGRLFWLGMSLFRETREAGVIDELGIESLLAEMLASIGPSEALRGNPPRWLGRVEDKIEGEFWRRLTLAELSAEAGVHPVHLSRVFRRWKGDGIGEYVQRLRVRSACEGMVSAERGLAELAAASGFADQSHFNRVFRRVAGMSPGRFRKIVSEREAAKGAKER